MMREAFSLGELEQALGATRTGADVSVRGVSIDSRRIAADDLFVALRGERFDGHEFIGQAAEQGAVAALVADSAQCPLPLLSVADTEIALGQLGAYNRSLYQGVLAAITGSCGKTSVKNMLSSIFASQGPTLATLGNLNNEIGVPLTLLRLAPEHRYAVIEMGAGKPGDIAYLVGLGKPQISLLLNAMPAHLERMGSLQGIAETKGAILSGLGGRGHAVFPADSEFTPLWRRLAGSATRLEFSFDSAAPVHVSGLALHAAGSSFQLHVDTQQIPVELPLPGRHNVANAMAAGAAAVAAGVPASGIAEGLAAVSATDGRLRSREGRDGVRVIDDSYNANPGSVAAAIDVLATTPGRRILVLGTMGELGEQVVPMHAQVGRYAAEQGIELLLGLGEYTQHATTAFGSEGRHFATLEALLEQLGECLQSGDTVLVKGSRSAAMERVVQQLVVETGEEVH
ncbi:MAG: UDP-N-acetylmuramoyl-tripeptide--D-alanyl-D-alanine ligase [Halieaceae bacterium]|jgi:UDP-N-acetylmuramoyl-tripeptide--D-alanyl-D-alanine ligase|nr:UDP-N-acetylmuramoyl-tripeptide--D-alanyl-D-alanine ligase [Halieaceae bacterium]